MRKLLHVQVDALTVVDFTMLYVVTRRLFLSSNVSSLVINLLTIFELTVRTIRNPRGGGGGAKYKKKYSYKGKLNEKKFLHAN